jgi:hypothetical protein
MVTAKKTTTDKANEKLNRICNTIQMMANDRREAAAFAALESLEGTNQDAADQRERAIRLAAEATGCLAALKVVRGSMVSA